MGANLKAVAVIQIHDDGMMVPCSRKMPVKIEGIRGMTGC